MIMFFGLSKTTSRFAPVILCTVIVIAFLLFSLGSHYLFSRGYAVLPTRSINDHVASLLRSQSDGYASPRNKTLGFERMIAVNMPHRWDRYDVVTLLSAASDLNITFSEGVYPKDTQNNSMPYRADWLKEAEVACTRAHANVWRKVVQEGWSSALIIESDADWDVAIKNQVSLVSQHMPEIVSKMHAKNKGSFSELDPYGATNWDMLVLGTCLETPRKDRKYVTFEDPSIPSMSVIPDWGITPLIPYYDKKSKEDLLSIEPDRLRRFLHKSPGTVCTTSYAISRRGAQRLLHTLSVRGYFAQVDLGIRDMIENNLLDVYTVLPPLMTQWKYNDVPNGNSDINPSPVMNIKRSPDVTGTFRSNEYFQKSTLMSLSEMLWP